MEPNGNVKVLESTNISFTGCTFVHLGGIYAISANFGSQHVRINNSTFTDVSGGAIHLGSSGSRWNTGPFPGEGGPSTVSGGVEALLGAGQPMLLASECDASNPAQQWSLSAGVEPGDGKPTILWTDNDGSQDPWTRNCWTVTACNDTQPGTPIEGRNCSVAQPPACQSPADCNACNGVFKLNSDGTITSAQDGRCVQVDMSEPVFNGSGSSGVHWPSGDRVNMAACTGGPSNSHLHQKFDVQAIPSAPGRYTVKDRLGGQCIGVNQMPPGGCGGHHPPGPRPMPVGHVSDWDGWFEVSDNHIHDMPTEFSGAVGIFGGYIFNSTIAHNTLERLTYTGISVGWGWNQVTFAGGNEIVNNSIDGVLPELADGGNIYCQSHARGSVISGNWLQNVKW